VNTTEAFHLTIATILFVGLFSFIMLPPPLNRFGEVVQGMAFTAYKISRALGLVTDATMCSMADQWNFGGMTATLESGENVSCGLLKEKKIALLPKERELYGDELGGYVQEVWITNKLVVNKMFFVTYLVLGLVAAAVITDIFITIRGKQYAGISGFGLMVALALSITMVFARLGILPELMGLFASVVVGQFVPGVFLMAMSLSVVWWVISQISLGYHVAKESYRTFAAVRVAARADVERGKKALETVENR